MRTTMGNPQVVSVGVMPAIGKCIPHDAHATAPCRDRGGRSDGRGDRAPGADLRLGLPLFDPHAGYTFPAAAGFESPVLRVALDLLDRKRAAIGAIDPERIAGRYSRSVDAAARELGVSGSTVRMAITQHRLPSWLRDGKLWLTPEHVDAFEVSGRGRRPRLTVTWGNRDGSSLRVRVIGGELE